MSDLSVSERRIRSIQDTVASGNLRQALQSCEKWQKKGEKSDRFLALRASILVNLSDKAQKEKGQTETLQLCRRTPAVTDVDAIFQLQDNLKKLSIQHEEGPKLWERAVAMVPNDKNLLMTWLNGSITDGNWLLAQKATAALRKAFPKERQYDFWNMLFSYLVSQDPRASEKERILFGQLAYRFISKAAESVPSDPSQLLAPGKAIATPDELAVLVKIYNSTGHTDLAIQLLQSDTLGLRSSLAEQDVQMVFALLIECLELCTDFDVVYLTVAKLLEGELSDTQQCREDERVWRILVKLAGIDDRLFLLCQKATDAVLDKQEDCRAARLAKLELLMLRAANNEGVLQELKSDCLKYLKLFNPKPFCFDDIVNPVRIAGFSTQKSLSDLYNILGPSESGKIIQAKLRYSTLSSESTESDILHFTVEALALHKALPDSRSESAEVALLAAMALLRLSIQSRQPEFQLQAFLILDTVSKSFNEFYLATARAVQLGRILGAISLSFQQFVSLSVKNLQWETVGHLSLTRISTLHPWQTGQAESALNPLGALDAGISVLESSEKSLNRALQQGLNNGSYSNVLDSVNVKRDVKQSLNRQIFNIEERKISRIVGMPVDTLLERQDYDLKDLRDFSFLKKYGAADDVVEDFLGDGPLPTKDWLESAMLADNIFTYLGAALRGDQPLIELSWDAICLSNSKVSSTSGNSLSGLTVDEMFSRDCQCRIADVLEQARLSTNAKADNLKQAMRQLSNLLKPTREAITTGITTINGVQIATSQYLHTCFTRLEITQTVALLLRYLDDKSKRSKTKNSLQISDEIGALADDIRQIEKQVRSQTEALRNHLYAAGKLGQLVDAATSRIDGSSLGHTDLYEKLGNELAGLYDDVVLEQFCGRLRESWEDALDGILAVKIKH